MKFIFASLFLFVFALMLLYAKRRFFAKLPFDATLKTLLVIALISIYVLVLLYFFNRFYDFLPSWAYYISSLSLGIGFIIFVFALCYELFVLLERFLRLSAQMKRIVEFAIFYSMLIYLSIGVLSAWSDIQVKKYSFVSSKITHDMKIVFLSDLHIGPLVDVAYVKNLVSLINAQKPDAVIVGGDLIDTNIDTITPELEELKKIQTKYGIFYALGNHEYFYNEDDIVKKLQSLGFLILQNSSFFLEVANIDILGIYDFMGFKKERNMPDLKNLNLDNSRFNMLVSHQPKVVNMTDFIPDKFDLVLSGHTHCGQIAPFGLLVLLDQPYLCGEYKLSQSSSLIISGGAGFWGPKMRIGSDFEIIVLELRRP